MKKWEISLIAVCSTIAIVCLMLLILYKLYKSGIMNKKWINNILACVSFQGIKNKIIDPLMDVDNGYIICNNEEQGRKLEEMIRGREWVNEGAPTKEEIKNAINMVDDIRRLDKEIQEDQHAIQIKNNHIKELIILDSNNKNNIKQ